MTDLASLLDADGASIEVDDDFDAMSAVIAGRRWGDGLPVVPPTEARVDAMLAWCDRAWDEPVGRIAPRYGEATPLRLAANAVMAGCEPRFFPLILLAIEAMCDERFNLQSIQATTHPCAPLMIFNGPVGREVGINSGANAFGPGVRANATIGRAIRLALLNIGGALPGVGDISTMGSPAKYTYCIAENEAANPWQPLHVERGFPQHATTLTIVGAECPRNVNDRESLDAEGILTTMAGTMATTGANDVHYKLAQPVVVLGPEHARTIADGGYSKDDVKRFLQQHAWLPLTKFSRENIERRLKVTFKERYERAGPDAPVYAVQRAQDLIVIVVGGVGRHSAYIPTWGGSSQVITLALKRRDGSLARSVEDFHCG